MPENNDAILLADTLDIAVQFRLFYFKYLQNTDLHKRWEINGVKLNSAGWILSHLIWTENYLLLHSCFGEPVDLPNFKEYDMGKDAGDITRFPSLDEIKSAGKEVHAKAMNHIRSFSGDDLNRVSTFGRFQFAKGENTVRVVIQHAIRHEGYHVGQLGTLAAINKIKIV